MVVINMFGIIGLQAAAASAAWHHVKWDDFTQSCERHLESPLSRFWGAQPYPDKSMLLDWFRGHDDPNVAILPKWDPPGELGIPFIDTHVAVRFLGGVSNYSVATQQGCTDSFFGGVWCDLVRRLPDGTLESRFDLVSSRLDRWVGNGMDVMIVLGNVPWAFVSTTEAPCLAYGCQYLPPDDPAEFADWVGELATYVKQSYGTAYASRIRWRLGTETNGPRWTNRGEYFQRHFDAYRLTAKRIREVLPSAEVGPSNWEEVVGHSGNFTPGGTDSFQYKFYSAIAADPSIPLDWIAVSHYGSEVNFPGSDYVQRTPSGTSGAFELQAMRELAKRPKATLEVHEWGILQKLGPDQRTPEPSSVGAAWTAASATTWVCHGVDRLFHWGTENSLSNSSAPFGRQHVTFYESWSWNMALLEMFIGGQARFATYDLTEPASPLNASIAMIESVKDDARYILLAAVGANRSDGFYTFVPLLFDAPGDGNFSIEQYHMNTLHSVTEMAIRDIIINFGNLDMFQHKDQIYPAPFNKMLTKEGQSYLQQPENLERYWQQNVENLKPQPYPDAVEHRPDGRILLHVKMDAFNVKVLVIRSSQESLIV